MYCLQLSYYNPSKGKSLDNHSLAFALIPCYSRFIVRCLQARWNGRLTVFVFFLCSWHTVLGQLVCLCLPLARLLHGFLHHRLFKSTSSLCSYILCYLEVVKHLHMLTMLYLKGNSNLYRRPHPFSLCPTLSPQRLLPLICIFYLDLILAHASPYHGNNQPLSGIISSHDNFRSLLMLFRIRKRNWFMSMSSILMKRQPRQRQLP